MEEYLKLFKKLLLLSQCDFCKVEMTQPKGKEFFKVQITFTSGLHTCGRYFILRFVDGSNNFSRLNKTLDKIMRDGGKLLKKELI